MNKKTDLSLTLKEKASLVVGAKTLSTLAIPEKGIEELVMSDGPCGLRLEEEGGDSLNQIFKARPASCFPAGVTLASSWNVDLANQMGVALGEECVNFGINILLGPAINIQRNPLCGRNFEYLSEDPLLAGTMGARIVSGIQAQGVGACVKHFACNNNEKYRFVGDSIVDMRALHEIYLKPFEIVTKEAGPRAFMSAYNRTNGVFCSENKYLLEDTLRSSWGFDGLVMTDWGGMVHRDVALKNGCDLEMPGMNGHNIKVVYDAVKNGTISEETLDKSVSRILDAKRRTTPLVQTPCDFQKHYDIALQIALEGAVLLKNDANTLPLEKNQKYLVVGGLFDTMRYQGNGSSLLNPIIIKNHKEAFAEYEISYDFALGYKESEVEPDASLEEEVLMTAKNHETILFFGGLNDYVESEGFDRDNMLLPANQLSLLDKLTKLGKKIVVVLFGGSPVELPFFDGVDAILDMMLPGEAGGEATAKLLLGEESPSGKLSQTWTMRYEDIPFGDEFVSSPYELYKESIFVGYRYYNTVNKLVRFPFGYGLSYSSFSYRDLSIKEDKGGVSAKLFVKNMGKRKGKEIVQLYAGKPDSKIVRPSIELKAFAKIELEAGEEKEVELFVSKDSLCAYFDNSFRLEEGEYVIYVGPSSVNLLLNAKISLLGETLASSKADSIYQAFLEKKGLSKEDFEIIIGRKIPAYEFGKRPYTMETTIGEFDTFVGRFFKNAVCGVGLRQYKKACRIEDGLRREREKKAGLFVYRLMPNNSLRSLSFSSSGAFSYPIAEGVLELSNGHLIRGIKAMLRKYKIKE